MKPTTEQIISKLNEINDECEYQHIGIRTQGVPFELGSIDHVSYVWVDSYETDEELPGLCVTKWTGSNISDIAMHANGSEEYFGDYTAIIGFDSYETGEDLGEAIAEDPEVLYIF